MIISKIIEETIEKLILSKNVVLAHVHNMIDEVIEMIYDTKAATMSMRKCKKALVLFITKLGLPNNMVNPGTLLHP